MKKKKVLIITSTIDCTVDYITQKYNGSVDFYRFDVDKFSDYEISIGGENQWKISCIHWSLVKGDIYSIYYRKPRIPDLSEFEKEYQYMIAKDMISTVNGLVDDFEGKVLSKPYLLRKTENKVFQLLYAKKNNLVIPESYIGNSDKCAREFLNDKSIIKPLTTGKVVLEDKTEIYQTNYFTELSEDITMMPVYIQKYQNKKYEVRMTYINGSFFTVRIESEDKLDWRKNYGGLKYTVIECPKQIADYCVKMLEDFKLEYGAFDFIVDEDERWIFLEVNPNGQWQWLEQILEIPISRRIVDYLID